VRSVESAAASNDGGIGVDNGEQRADDCDDDLHDDFGVYDARDDDRRCDNERVVARDLL
jgi:hypothetical protein